MHNREDGSVARGARRILIRRHKPASQLGCAESVKPMRAGEGQVQRDAYAAPFVLGELEGPSHNICFPDFRVPCFRGPGEFCWEFSGVGSGGPSLC